MATHSSVLPWRIPGTGGLVGCGLWGRTESDMTEATQQQQQRFLSLWYSSNNAPNCATYLALKIGTVQGFFKQAFWVTPPELTNPVRSHRFQIYLLPKHLKLHICNSDFPVPTPC